MTSPPSRPANVVALLADVPSTGLLGEYQAQRFPLRGNNLAERSTEFVAFAQHHIGQGRRVIALYPRWHADAAQRAVAFARGSLQTDHIGQVGIDLAPLALSLIADQLAYLAPYVPPGVVAALADELPEHVLAGAWLERVSGLATIPITFRQHVGSYMPKTTFLAFSAPVKRVGRVKKGDPSPNIPSRPIEPVQILIARPEGHDIEEFNEQFTPALRPVSLSALPEQPLGSTYWGMRKYIEFVAFSAHPQALANTVRAIRPSTCDWCQQLVAGLNCPFCGAVNQPSAGRPPTRKANVPPPPARTTGEHIRPAWVSNRPKGASEDSGEQPGRQRSSAQSASPPQAQPQPDTGSRPSPTPGGRGQQSADGPHPQHPHAYPQSPPSGATPE
ncbi:hypothetical protein [Allosalinactinospora lopnorensis]|uniref:hypothetical protein n=1 Tax=Allosalinactinospora lopnorensis TaxID=1352348 RepID=UPI000AC25E5E|nr:hypothetical protein [Allosalinactinospora lopnorensis]